MTSPQDSQQFDSYIPVYDAIPDKWEEARPLLVERLKEISTSLNFKEIGWFLDEELLTGKAFVPSSTNNSGTQGQFRTVLRYVLNVGPITTGSNTATIPVVFDANFTLVDMWVAATNSSTLKASIITDTDLALSSSASVTTVTFTSPGNFNIGWFIIEYLQEP